MPVFLVSYSAAMLGLVAPLAAIALLVGGVSLIASSIHMRREVLTRRVDLIEARTTAVRAEAQRQARQSRPHFLRLPTGRLSEPQQREIFRLLSKLGLSAHRALAYFTVVRFVGAAGLGLLALFWVGTLATFAASQVVEALIALAGTVFGWFLPTMFIDFRLKLRSRIVSTGLPNAVELLVVCVEAGLSLEDELDRVVREIALSQPALADELALTLAELKILPSRDQALANLAERVDVPAVRSIVATLSQTLQYGTPLARSLRVVAAEMRNEFLLQLEERANRLPALLTLPVVLLILPTMFLILGGPAALQVIDTFQH